MRDDCCPSNGLLSVDAALAQLQQAACTVLPKVETIALTQALGRILAQDVVSGLDVPPQANSAMDGYAIIYEDKNNELNIIDTIFAGDNNSKLLEKNSCIKIMTGAKIPNNATAIIPKEDTEKLNDNKIKIIKNGKR